MFSPVKSMKLLLGGIFGFDYIEYFDGDYSMKKVMVIGANGYIGSHVVTELLSVNCKVLAIDVSESNYSTDVDYIQASIFDNLDCIVQYADKVDVCIDLAWRNGFLHDSDTHIQDLWGHYFFVKQMIENGLKHFVGMGTMHEIGYWEGKVDEFTPCNPLSKYGIAKNALRQLVIAECKRNNVIYQWLRGFYITGDDYKNHSVFAKIAEASMRGNDVFPFTSGENKYDFSDVHDVARQIVAASLQDSKQGIINCCSGKAISLREKAEQYIHSNNLSIRLEFGAYPDRPYDSPIIYGDVNAIDEIMKKEK